MNIIRRIFKRTLLKMHLYKNLHILLLTGQNMLA